MKGVDGGHLGQFDLSLSLGIPGQFDSPQIQSTINRLADTCKRLGKTAACMAPTMDIAKDWQRRGFRMISYSTDTALLQAGLRDGLQELRRLEG